MSRIDPRGVWAALVVALTCGCLTPHVAAADRVIICEEFTATWCG
jgi:hypothetical protein